MVSLYSDFAEKEKGRKEEVTKKIEIEGGTLRACIEQIHPHAIVIMKPIGLVNVCQMELVF
jgi:hypothetical protein